MALWRGKNALFLLLPHHCPGAVLTRNPSELWPGSTKSTLKSKSAFSQSSVLLEEVIQFNDSRGEVHQVHKVRCDNVDTHGSRPLSFHPVQDGRKIPTQKREQRVEFERTLPEMETRHFHSCNKSTSIEAQVPRSSSLEALALFQGWRDVYFNTELYFQGFCTGKGDYLPQAPKR